VIAMPLTKKGWKIYLNMIKTYGVKKGRQVFYASKNAGRIKGVDRSRKKKSKKRRRTRRKR